jgi:hypothetical protein
MATAGRGKSPSPIVSRGTVITGTTHPAGKQPQPEPHEPGGESARSLDIDSRIGAATTDSNLLNLELPQLGQTGSAPVLTSNSDWLQHS